MSEENVAIVKSSWAGWRQGLRDQWVRDFDGPIAERMDAWAAETGNPDLQPEEFIDAGDVVIVRARPDGGERPLWFRYELSGPRIVGWDVYDEDPGAGA